MLLKENGGCSRERRLKCSLDITKTEIETNKYTNAVYMDKMYRTKNANQANAMRFDLAQGSDQAKENKYTYTQNKRTLPDIKTRSQS